MMTSRTEAAQSLSLTSTIEVPQDVLFRDLGGEAVVLNISSGQYYGLDEMATRMWTLFAEGCSLAQVIDCVTHEYDVDPSQVQRDLTQLVTQLQGYGLIRSMQAAA